MEDIKRIKIILEQLSEQANFPEYGNIDFIIQNGDIVRVDIRNSIKADKIQTIHDSLKKTKIHIY